MERRTFFELLALAPAWLHEQGGRSAAPWKAGTARVDITPPVGVWMAGFAARTCPSEGVAQRLQAKALALQDPAGARLVLVTADVLGVPAAISARVAARLHAARQLAPAELVINASHTHCGPVIGDSLRVAYDLSPERWDAIRLYTAALEAKLGEAAERALDGLVPAQLAFATGSAPFAANRRVQFGPGGPVSYDVPVLAVHAGSGHLMAIVFGYACHNTTLQASFCEFHGDYAGVAQALVEERHGRATALFVAGCGADVNPRARGTLDLAQQHGRTLADAVELALGNVVPLGGRCRAAAGKVDLPLAPPLAPEEWVARYNLPEPYVARHAELMRRLREREGALPRAIAEPVHVWRIGALTFVALGGEVVVDYARRLAREHEGGPLWVAGYSTDVPAYVPSRRVLEEGGYEGGGAMLYYGQPAPFDPSVEDRLIGAIARLLRSTA